MSHHSPYAPAPQSVPPQQQPSPYPPQQPTTPPPPPAPTPAPQQQVVQHQQQQQQPEEVVDLHQQQLNPSEYDLGNLGGDVSGFDGSFNMDGLELDQFMQYDNSGVGSNGGDEVSFNLFFVSLARPSSGTISSRHVVRGELTLSPSFAFFPHSSTSPTGWSRNPTKPPQKYLQQSPSLRFVVLLLFASFFVFAFPPLRSFFLLVPLSLFAYLLSFHFPVVPLTTPQGSSLFALLSLSLDRSYPRPPLSSPCSPPSKIRQQPILHSTSSYS